MWVLKPRTQLAAALPVLLWALQLAGGLSATRPAVKVPPPESPPAGLSFLTLGDFGATLPWQGSADVDVEGNDKDPMCQFALTNSGHKGWGSRVNEKGPYVACNSEGWWRQWHAQAALALLMGDSSARIKPKAVITQGDNFYWDGVANPQSEMFQAVFEDIYTAPNLVNIPWLMCLGNHDVGGTGFLCGTDPGTAEANDMWHRECTSAEETREAVLKYFNAQKEYKGKNQRWVFEGAFYKKEFKDGDIKVDVFTVDTNVATTHGMKEICCQCFGYGNKDTSITCAKGKNAASCGMCSNIEVGKPHCAPPDIYNACTEVLEGWFEESMAGLEKALEASDATWKVISSHYCPVRHFAAADKEYKRIMTVIGGKAHIWLCGHTHAPSHDYQNGTGIHYIMDGSGGGITAEAAGGTAPGTGAQSYWEAGGVYAFTELYFGPQWATVRFLGPDKTWRWDQTFTKGGSEELYCSHIPVDGGPAVQCKDAKNWKPSTSAPSRSPTQGGSGGEGDGVVPSSSGGDAGGTTGKTGDGQKETSAARQSLIPASCFLIYLAMIALLMASAQS